MPGVYQSRTMISRNHPSVLLRVSKLSNVVESVEFKPSDSMISFKTLAYVFVHLESDKEVRFGLHIVKNQDSKKFSALFPQPYLDRNGNPQEPIFSDDTIRVAYAFSGLMFNELLSLVKRLFQGNEEWIQRLHDLLYERVPEGNVIVDLPKTEKEFQDSFPEFSDLKEMDVQDFEFSDLEMDVQDDVLDQMQADLQPFEDETFSEPSELAHLPEEAIQHHIKHYEGILASTVSGADQKRAIARVYQAYLKANRYNWSTMETIFDENGDHIMQELLSQVPGFTRGQVQQWWTIKTNIMMLQELYRTKKMRGVSDDEGSPLRPGNAFDLQKMGLLLPDEEAEAKKRQSEREKFERLMKQPDLRARELASSPNIISTRSSDSPEKSTTSSETARSFRTPPPRHTPVRKNADRSRDREEMEEDSP